MIQFFILLIIYLAFISLGLPDSVLGAAIPALQREWGMALGEGGIISLVVIGGTIVSSFASGYTLRRFSTGHIVLVSCLLTGGALMGYSLAPSYMWLIVFAVPLGLGGGTVDIALNDYVALHFRAHHMNWLHSFWGVGATLGPLIMSWNLEHLASWRSGYRTIAFLQLTLAAGLLLSLPLWGRVGKSHTEGSDPHDPAADAHTTGIFRIRGIPYAFGTMLLYGTAEISAGLWGSSFLVNARGFSIESAASWIALYYGGITVGRFLSGFISFRLSNRRMIRAGILTASTGVLLLFVPLPGFLIGASFVLIGLGLSPVFPAMLHETPARFGPRISRKILGYQMGFSYIGSAALPPLLGFMLQNVGMGCFPAAMAFCAGGMLFLSERLNVMTPRSLN